MIPAGEAAPGPNEFPPRPLSFFTISSQLIIAPFLSVSRILIKLMTNAFLRVKAAGFGSIWRRFLKFLNRFEITVYKYITLFKNVFSTSFSSKQ